MVYRSFNGMSGRSEEMGSLVQLMLLSQLFCSLAATVMTPAGGVKVRNARLPSGNGPAGDLSRYLPIHGWLS